MATRSDRSAEERSKRLDKGAEPLPKAVAHGFYAPSRNRFPS